MREEDVRMDEQQQGRSKQPRPRREFTKEFKRDAVELVRTSGRPIAYVARDLGIYDSTWATGCARTPSTEASVRGFRPIPATGRWEQQYATIEPLPSTRAE
jgi:hypothetical protein